MLENNVLRKKHGPKRDGVTGEKRLINQDLYDTPHQTFEGSNQEK